MLTYVFQSGFFVKNKFMNEERIIKQKIKDKENELKEAKATHVRLDSLTIKATRFQVPFLLPLAIKTARWKELNI